MDFAEELEWYINTQESKDHEEEFSSIFSELIQCLDGPSPPSAPPSPPPAPPVTVEQPSVPHSSAAPHSQNLPYGVVPYLPSAAARSYPAAPQELNLPVVHLPEEVSKNLTPIGFINGNVLYGYVPPPSAAPPPTSAAPPPTSAAPPPTPSKTSSSNKRKRADEEDRPYIKKPPNAFLLFMKEQRPTCTVELQARGSSVVNSVLGQRWKSLSKDQQAKYYEEAAKEKRLHAQLHPDWSSTNNYGKKRKRDRTNAATKATASASSTCYAHVAEPSTSSYIHVAEPSSSSFTNIGEFIKMSLELTEQL